MVSPMNSSFGQKTTPSETELSAEEMKLVKSIGVDKEIARKFKSHCGSTLYRLERKSAVIQMSSQNLKYETRQYDAISATCDSKRSYDIVFALAKELENTGYEIYISQKNYTFKPDEISLIKSADHYGVLKIEGTAGINYDIDNMAVIEQLKEWEERYPFMILGAAMDRVEIKFKEELPDDIDSLTKEVYAFCPDIVEEDDDPEKRIAEMIRQDNRLTLWWD